MCKKYYGSEPWEDEDRDDNDDHEQEDDDYRSTHEA